MKRFGGLPPQSMAACLGPGQLTLTPEQHSGLNTGHQKGLETPA